LQNVSQLLRKKRVSKITIIAELDKYESRDGRRKIYIRLTQERKHRRIDTGIKIIKKEWNGKHGGWIKNSNADCQDLNLIILNRISSYQKTYLNLVAESSEVLIDTILQELVKKTTKHDFIAYWDKRVARMTNYNQSKGYHTTKIRIKTFIGSATLEFKTITPDWLDNFANYCRGTIGNHTLHSHLRRIRVVYNAAIKEGIVERASYPFFIFTMPKIKQTELQKLTKEQLLLLFSLNYSKKDLKFWVLGGFELSFRCAGIRIEDLLCLKWNNIRDGKLIYRMNKGITGGTIMTFEVTGMLAKLLDKLRHDDSKESDFILPFLKPGDDEKDNTTYKKLIGSKTAQVNHILKKIAKDIDLNVRLTTHLARHSWAAYTYGQTLDIKFTQECLGHSQSKVTEKYIGRLDSSVKLRKLREVELK
jgi:integrase/recombinase XerD